MRFIPFVLVVAAVVAHAASETSSPESPASATSATAPSASAPVAVVASTVAVPDLEIEWSCGECKPNEKVPPLIRSGYANAAGASHSSIADGDKVHVKITAYRQRNPALRSLFGFMAGKDELTVSVSWHGKQASAHDYEANAWHGMNAVAESVGKKTFAAVQKFLASERSVDSNAAR